MLTICRSQLESPLGTILALASDEGLCALEFPRSYAARSAALSEPQSESAARSAALSGPRSDNALHDRLQRRLQRWFPPHEIVDRETPVLARTRHWLAAYFDGASADLPPRDELPLDLRGAPFERRVWAALIEIPAGATASYGAIAAKLNAPGASRAVGAANGANPVSIIVPCHRVIGSSGKLTGYGGGLDRKKWLLDHEARWRNDWLF